MSTGFVRTQSGNQTQRGRNVYLQQKAGQKTIEKHRVEACTLLVGASSHSKGPRSPSRPSGRALLVPGEASPAAGCLFQLLAGGSRNLLLKARAVSSALTIRGSFLPSSSHRRGSGLLEGQAGQPQGPWCRGEGPISTVTGDQPGTCWKGGLSEE